MKFITTVLYCFKKSEMRIYCKNVIPEHKISCKTHVPGSMSNFLLSSHKPHLLQQKKNFFFRWGIFSILKFGTICYRSSSNSYTVKYYKIIIIFPDRHSEVLTEFRSPISASFIGRKQRKEMRTNSSEYEFQKNQFWSNRPHLIPNCIISVMDQTTHRWRTARFHYGHSTNTFSSKNRDFDGENNLCVCLLVTPFSFLVIFNENSFIGSLSCSLGSLLFYIETDKN